MTLAVKQGGGPNSQFYLLDIGSCWKNNGDPCDGHVLTDVTRYNKMIINPATTSWCHANNLVSCPPYHVSRTGEKIYRNETSQFPFSAYHLYYSPGNANYLEEPYDICDPYSNPQAQELGNWCKFCHILNGLCMDILKSKEMDGLETLGLWCLMWVLSRVDYSSTSSL